MPRAAVPASLSLEPTLPFRYVGGDPSLDLVNTVDWTSRGPASDRLTDYQRLVEWGEGSGVIGPAEGSRLRALARRNPGAAAAAYDAARSLRRLLQRLFVSIAAGRPSATTLAGLNTALGDALARLELAPGGERSGDGEGSPLGWRWRDASTHLESPLWPVVWSAARLAASDEAARIRACADPECGWMYVDRSRNGLRRWCQMETCGTRAKTERRRSRA